MANMTKKIQDGNVLDFKAHDNISYMEVVPLTSTTSVALGVGVAMEPIKAGDIGALDTRGVFEFPSDTEAMAFGEEVYWDKSENKITKTSTNNTPAGMVVEDKAANATTVKVRIG